MQPPRTTEWRRLIPMVLRRGLRRRCPQCGIGRVFSGWHTVQESCPHCQLDLDSREGDTWAFMYITTAALTGLFVAVMLLVTPESLGVARMILLPAALLVIAGTLPIRKSVAIALDYLSELAWDNHRNRQPRFEDNGSDRPHD